MILEIVASVTREKLEPPVPPAELKAPRTLSFLLLMRRSAREKSLSVSDSKKIIFLGVLRAFAVSYPRWYGYNSLFYPVNTYQMRYYQIVKMPHFEALI